MACEQGEFLNFFSFYLELILITPIAGSRLGEFLEELPVSLILSITIPAIDKTVPSWLTEGAVMLPFQVIPAL
jgi:hypothetical protein